MQVPCDGARLTLHPPYSCCLTLGACWPWPQGTSSSPALLPLPLPAPHPPTHYCCCPSPATIPILPPTATLPPTPYPLLPFPHLLPRLSYLRVRAVSQVRVGVQCMLPQSSEWGLTPYKHSRGSSGPGVWVGTNHIQ